MPAITVRLPHVFGPGPLTQRSHLNRLLQVIAWQEGPKFFGNLDKRRRYAYIGDAIGSFVSALSLPEPPLLLEPDSGMWSLNQVDRLLVEHDATEMYPDELRMQQQLQATLAYWRQQQEVAA